MSRKASWKRSKEMMHVKSLITLEYYISGKYCCYFNNNLRTCLYNIRDQDVFESSEETGKYEKTFACLKN